jgi:hypothetical protein
MPRLTERGLAAFRQKCRAAPVGVFGNLGARSDIIHSFSINQNVVIRVSLSSKTVFDEFVRRVSQELPNPSSVKSGLLSTDVSSETNPSR